MSYRIAWLSPLTPTSGVGTFSHAITRHIPASIDGEPIDVTILYVGHERLYRSPHRSFEIGDGESFHQVLSLFDVVIYNIGNNREHHDPIFALLRLCPGIVICHDYVYQNYLADRASRRSKSFTSFAALMLKYGGPAADRQLRRSRFTDRRGRRRYMPWETVESDQLPLSDVIMALGSAIVVHSAFAQRHAETHFEGPVLRLGMPYDQKPVDDRSIPEGWPQHVLDKTRFEMVSVGHIQATKCIDLVLEALASSSVLQRRIRYTIVGFAGDAGYFNHLKGLVADLRLQDCVAFEVDVSERRLTELMRRADIFSNLRRPNTEGSSVSLIEQLDTGKPVIVIDRGSYADIPADAAIKLPRDAGSRHVRDALEALIESPASMIAIGQAGRAYARTWTCAAYARELLSFAFAHRPLLSRRSQAVAIQPRRPAEPFASDRWVLDLARARRSLTYADRNVSEVDPGLVMHQTAEERRDYVAHVLFGMFGNTQLERALSRYFARLDARGRYWACVQFSVIADAVFDENDAARERLVHMRVQHDPEFWSVIEALPGRLSIAAATLMLAKRPLRPEEVETLGVDDQTGAAKRSRMAELVRALAPSPGSPLEHLGQWLDTPRSAALARELQVIEADFECAVGSDAFKERADLAGFHVMEADHSWTRGSGGRLGLRLGGCAARVEVLMSHICASAARPATIGLSYEDVTTALEITDCQPHWLSIEVPAGGEASPRMVWLEISTNRTAVPANSIDTRSLGICCLRLRVTPSPDAQGAQAETPPAHLDQASPANIEQALPACVDETIGIAPASQPVDGGPALDAGDASRQVAVPVAVGEAGDRGA